jgi:fermentation-respiration switch protein FrsA (DUF1100 family)
LKVVLLAAAIIYVAIAGVVWLAQDNLVFHPMPAAATPVAASGWNVDEVTLDAADGTKLAGVLLRPHAPARAPLVIYFGGNAEEVTAHASEVPALYGERAALLMNYRGYGASAGRPSEAALVADAARIFDWAAGREDIDASRIAIHGRSLGTGVAVQLAAARNPRCVVLTTPFASALDVAREAYPWLPVAAMLRHPFDSGSRAPAIKVPLLVVSATDDTVIAPRHAEKLASLWGGSVERLSIEGFGHNDLDLHPRYAQTIRAFIDRCMA